MSDEDNSPFQRVVNVEGSKTDAGYGWLVWGGAITCGVVLAGYLLTSEKDRLAEKYHVPQSKIFIRPKPHGCDFADAPLGNKHCHYEQEVSTEKACLGPDCQVTGVYVSWRKVDEE
jgi:hypothetical protein